MSDTLHQGAPPTYTSVGQYVRAKFSKAPWLWFWIVLLGVPAKVAIQAKQFGSGWSAETFWLMLVAIPFCWIALAPIWILALTIGGYVNVNAHRLPKFLRQLHETKISD